MTDDYGDMNFNDLGLPPDVTGETPADPFASRTSPSDWDDAFGTKAADLDLGMKTTRDPKTQAQNPIKAAIDSGTVGIALLGTFPVDEIEAYAASTGLLEKHLENMDATERMLHTTLEIGRMRKAREQADTNPIPEEPENETATWIDDLDPAEFEALARAGKNDPEALRSLSKDQRRKARELFA